MLQEKNKEATALNRTIERYNLIIIAFLCSSTLSPALIFYFQGPGEVLWLIIILAFCYCLSRIPDSFLDKIQFSQQTSFYDHLHVPLFKKFATNGDFINRQIRKRFPMHRNITNIASIQQKLEETYRVEKAHWILFLGCLCTSVHALLLQAWSTAAILCIGNVLFNFYPNLLQQYNRIRYKQILSRHEGIRKTLTP